MKGQLEELGEETDENVENISKMQGQILNMTGGKVNIFDASGDFKSTYEIMQGIAEVWDELSSIDQADLLETIAGKNRANDVAALLSNWENVEAAVKSASEAEGSAAAENAKYIDSIQGRLDKLTTAWQSFANTFMNSDFLKGAISGLTTFVELVEKLVNKTGSLGTIGLGAGIFGFIKNFSTLKTLGKDVFTALTTNAMDSYEAFKKWSEASDGVVSGGKKIASSLSGIIGGIGLAVAAVSLIINAYKNYREEISKARQETIQASDNFLDSASSFEQAYIKYSGKTSLTVEEEADLESAINGTVDALDNKSSALQNVVNSSNDYVSSLEQIAKEELKAANSAARQKRDNAEKELIDTAMGWTRLNGSAVDIEIASDEAIDVVNKMNSNFVKEYSRLTNDLGGTATYTEIELPSDADINQIIDYYDFLLEYQKELSNANLIDTDDYANVSKSIKTMSELVDTYIDGLYDATKAQYQLSNGIPKTTEEYLKMRETILDDNDIKNLSLDARSTIANTLDSEYKQIFDLSSVEAQARKFIGLIKGYGDGTKDGINEIGTVETFLNMRTAVNNNECTVGEYLSQFDEINDLTKSWSEEEKELFNTSFGLDTDTIKQQYKDTFDYLSRLYDNKDTQKMSRDEEYDYKFKVRENNKKVEEFLNSLTADELDAVIDIRTEIDWKNTSVEDIRKQIEDRVRLNEALNFTIAIDVESESIELLNAAMAESVSGTGLSSESITALKSRYSELASEGYDLSAMFEETSNGIHLNRKAVNELEQEYAKQKLSETNDNLKVLKDKYDELTDEINNASDVSERASLYREQQSIVQKINDLSTLASQYQGLTSAYNAWLNAEEAGSERDMYENIIEGFETAGDEISRGWIDDGTIKFLELLTGQTDLASKSGRELKEIYDSLNNTIGNSGYSISDFFTVDEDGNSTNTGVYNFLETVESFESQLGDVIKRGEDGSVIGFDFEVAGGDKAIAEVLGVSEELVQIMVRAADDAGFVVNIDGAYTQLADLKTEAEAARDSLITLKRDGLESLQDVDVTFDLEATGNDLIKEQEKAINLLNKFRKEDGTIDLSITGAQEALDIAEYLTIRIDDLTEPKYMQVDASSLEEELQEPIEKMQEFERLSKEKHLLTLTGDTTKLAETEAKMDEIAQYLDDIDDKEVQAKLGITGLTKEEIAKKLEKGEIELDAELSIDVQMSDDLKDMRLMMMNQLGLVSNEEVKLKIGFDIDDSVVDKLTDEQKQVVVEYLVNDEDIKDYTPEQKEALVKYIADGGSLDGFTPEEKVAFVNYLVDGGNVEGYTPEDKKAFAKYLVDGGDPDSYQPPSKQQEVKADLDSSEPDNYQPDEKTQPVTAKLNSSAVDNYKPPEKEMTIWARIKKVASDLWDWVTGGGGVNGTANVNGTTGRAFVRGDWRTKKTENALVGELGREIVVTPNNQWYTVGDNGAEFADIPKGSIVFNNRQTEELFRNGRVTSGGGRGKALANGTAFSGGTGAGFGKVTTVTEATTEATPTTTTTTTTTKTTTGGSSGSGGGTKVNGKSVASTNEATKTKEAEKEFEDTIDWIETILDRAERAIDKYEKQANNIYKTWDKRNEALENEISEVNNTRSLYEQAKNQYLSEANAVGLDESYASKVRNGSLNIEDFKGESDETLVEKIKNYQDLYEKYLDCIDKIEELKEQEASLYAQRFDNVQSEYDNLLQGFDHTQAMLEEYVNQAESKGYIVSKNYYDALIKNEQDRINTLKQEQISLIKARDEAVANNEFDKYSEDWYRMCEEIDSVTQAIESGATSLIEYNNAIRDIDFEVFELMQERISDITAEADFLIELMSHKDLFDDKGNLTEQGQATIGLHGQNYNTYMYQADEYGAKAAEIDKQIAEDPYDQELINKRREYLELQRECILNAENEKEAIKSLVEEGIEIELDSLSELIDKYQDALQSQKDLYDYQKRVEEQTKNIASLQKQLAAYEGDDSEESKKRIQELKVSLEEAESDLQETEYDKYISDTSALLDNLYTEYELMLNERIDNLDYLIAQQIEAVNANASVISETLSAEADAVGYTLSSAMTDIWNGEQAVLTMYGEDFKLSATNINTTLNGIKTSIDNMVVALNKKAEEKIEQPETKSSSVEDPVKIANNNNNTNDNNNKKEEPKRVITNDTLMGIAAAIWNYQKENYGGWGANPDRKKKLTDKLGAENAAKVQSYINSYGATGKLYNFWISKGKNLNDYKYSAFKLGAKNIDETQLAWTQEQGQEYIIRPSDGAILTPVAKGDSVLTSAATNNIWQMANSPTEFIRDNLSLGATSIPNNSTVQNSITQNFDKVVFSMPNVRNYDELITQMQKDPNFERLVETMSIGKLTGKSSLAKGKAIR